MRLTGQEKAQHESSSRTRYQLCCFSSFVFKAKNGMVAPQLAIWRNFVPLVNKDTVSELLRVFTYPKFRLEKAEQALLLADFLPYAETLPKHDAPLNLPMIRDPADQMFLALAVVGKADALVTGDCDLLVIKHSFKTLPIMTPGEFEQWLRQ